MATDEITRARTQWLLPFLSLSARTETRLRTVFVSASQDAYEQVSALENDSTFSAGVRTAQIRILLDTLQPILKVAFDATIPIIRNGQQDAAVLAVDTFSKTDRNYLQRAIEQSGIDFEGFSEGQRQQARLGIINAISSLTKTDYKLSTKVYGANVQAKQWVKTTVTSGILRGLSAQEIAKNVRASIRPDTPGGVSYAALRVARTELNNAFHATAIEIAKDRPWVTGMDWNLSKTHSSRNAKGDKCDDYAQRSWRVEDVPAKPHPQCRCFVTPTLVPYEAFVKNLTAGQYRSWIDEAA